MTASFFTDFVGPFPDVLWEPAFLSSDKHSKLLAFCVNEIPWAIKQMTFGAKTVNVPRELAWYGDVPYTYSGLKHKASPMPAPLRDLAKDISAYLQKQGLEQEFNSVLLNRYRSGDDTIGMHSDDESQLLAQPVIASVSLGDPRTFVFQNKSTGLRHKNLLIGGSLLVMKGDCQDMWRHGIPREPGRSHRVNLTFRRTYL
jgi:alkylated DNA repair dioxygenase AlkB